MMTLYEYEKLVVGLSTMPEAEKIAIVRHLARTDLFFLLWFILGRKDAAKPWLLARCQEVQQSPDGHLDLWAREHYKSTIITFALTIMDILATYGDDPILGDAYNKSELTFGIFSFNRGIAKEFLKQLKREFEQNELLKKLFPDILWSNPEKEAPKWSDNEGLILKRKSNPKEASVEAWGYVDGQPTSKHFDRVICDDLVTIDSINTPGAMQKCLDSWELMQNLGTADGKWRYIGTRYHMNDLYRTMIERKAVKVRQYAATTDGTLDGDPVLIPREKLDEKYRIMGPYTFACQMLQDPKSTAIDGFTLEDVQFYDTFYPDTLNKYIIIDPANTKKKSSDYTAAWVIGLGADNNYYVIDMIRDRLSLTERADLILTWHKKYRPMGVGYEQYGMQADIQYLKERMAAINYRFNITPLGGKIAKTDRIRKLLPLFRDHRFYFPHSLYKTSYEGKTEELVDVFIHQELLSFPVPYHDDMLDALARIVDENLRVSWPRGATESNVIDKYVNKFKNKNLGSGWAS